MMIKPHLFKQWNMWFCVEAKNGHHLAFGGYTPTEAYAGWFNHQSD